MNANEMIEKPCRVVNWKQKPKQSETLDTERLEQTLGQPAWHWLRERLVKLLRSKGVLPQKTTLVNATDQEVTAYRRLFANTTGSDKRLTVDISKLDEILKQAGICENLIDAIEHLEGPCFKTYQQNQQDQKQWEEILHPVLERYQEYNLEISKHTFLSSLKFWKKHSANQKQEAERLATSLFEAYQQVQDKQTEVVGLAELAVSCFNDAHALDRGRPMGTALLQLLGESVQQGSELWRRSWKRHGVMCDQLNSQVLVLNLRYEEGYASKAINAFANLGEPLRLSLALLRKAKQNRVTSGLEKVYICENPNVLSTIAEQLDGDAPTMVCTEGQASIAAIELLAQLDQQGSQLYYHGDFDWPGIVIANTLFNKFPNLKPWFMKSEDYLSIDSTYSLKGNPVHALWDPRLAPAMENRGVAVHEEATLPLLLTDLKRN